MSSLAAPPFGALLRGWRQRRRLTQLDLALRAEVSTRHLSFVETGRARPSAEMVVHLADQLEVPLRERNDLLLAAGYAPRYAQLDLDAEEMGPVRDALTGLLAAHEPNPALVVDRHWGLVAANRALEPLLEGVAAHLLEPPVNVLRLSLHPEGVAPRIVNLGVWRGHLLRRLGHELLVSGDPALAALRDELAAYPHPELEPSGPGPAAPPEIATPLRLRIGGAELAFMSTVTTFGTATEVTVSELSLETFLPADAATAHWLSDRPAG